MFRCGVSETHAIILARQKILKFNLHNVNIFWQFLWGYKKITILFKSENICQLLGNIKNLGQVGIMCNGQGVQMKVSRETENSQVSLRIQTKQMSAHLGTDICLDGFPWSYKYSCEKKVNGLFLFNAVSANKRMKNEVMVYHMYILCISWYIPPDPWICFCLLARARARAPTRPALSSLWACFSLCSTWTQTTHIQVIFESKFLYLIVVSLCEILSA